MNTTRSSRAQGRDHLDAGDRIGRSEITSEHLLGTATGLMRSRAIRRLTAGSRADRALLESVQCVCLGTQGEVET